MPLSIPPYLQFGEWLYPSCKCSGGHFVCVSALSSLCRDMGLSLFGSLVVLRNGVQDKVIGGVIAMIRRER